MNNFLHTSAQNFDPIFDRIGKDQMLISASDGTRTNTMTASWGGCGVLWNLPIAVCLIRPQRFTYGIIEESERFSLSFFDGGYREALRYCGTHSGRDGDKFTAAGLTCSYTADGVPYPSEAARVLICRKLYTDVLKAENFLDTALLSHYKIGDFHKMYIGEIETVLKRKTVE